MAAVLGAFTMAQAKFLLLCALGTLAFERTCGLGILIQPTVRGSNWSNESGPIVNPNAERNDCGGLTALIKNGGKCGVCGDDYSLPRPRPNENTGLYGNGLSVRQYKRNRKIVVQAFLHESKGGHFRYSICSLSTWDQIETEECFRPLKFVDQTDKYELAEGAKGVITSTLILPEDLTCRYCVLRWEHVTQQIDRGQPEVMRNCADVEIV